MKPQDNPVQFGSVAYANFEENTIGVEMEPGYIVASGPVALVPRATFDELLGALIAIRRAELEDMDGDDDIHALRKRAEDAIVMAGGTL